MFPGYNQPRPTAENYREFETRLTSGMSELGIDGLSLLLYGSYVRGDYNPGRSDIDAILIFPSDFVIDKEDLSRASVVLCQALDGTNIPFQVTVTDIATMRDGRFNSYDESFKKYFEGESRITGQDYRSDITYELPTMDEQVALRFNLRKTRTGLLFAEHDRKLDYESFLRKFTKSLDAASRGSKQILSLVDGELRMNRFSAIDAIADTFPEVNTEVLSRIKMLYQDLTQLDALFEKPDEILSLWNSAVTFMEEMIRAYVKSNPRGVPNYQI